MADPGEPGAQAEPNDDPAPTSDTGSSNDDPQDK